MWSYSGNPQHSPTDLVRFLIGDTNKTDQLLTDEEIQYVLSLYNNAPPNAAIRCCETIMAKFSRLADESAGSVSVSFSQKATSYRSMLADLRTRLSMEDMTAYAGGLSVADKLTIKQNQDRVRPDFSKHMMENREVAPFASTSVSVDNFGTKTED